MLPTNNGLASLTLVGGLIFKPSLWRRYIASIDTQLSPDFALIELQKHQWQHPTLRRLLYLGHGVWPVGVSMGVTLISWGSFGVNGETLFLTTGYALFLSGIGGFLGSLTVSVAFGIMIGIVGGVLLSLPVAFADKIVFSMAENIAIIVMTVVISPPDLLLPEQPLNDFYAQLTVLLGIFAAGQAGSIMNSTTTLENRSPSYRQIGSVVVGVLVSGLVMVFMITLAGMLALGAAQIPTEIGYILAMDGLIAGLFGLFFTFIWFWHTLRWKSSLLIGLSVTLLFELITFLKNTFVTDPLGIALKGIHGGIENALLFSLLFVFPYLLAKRIANLWSGIIAGIFGSAGIYIAFNVMMGRYTLAFIMPLTLLALVLGLSVNGWRPLLFYPFVSAWNLLLQRFDENRQKGKDSLLRWHSAFWDEHQRLPLFGLENYLVMVTEHHPHEGQAALDYLSSGPQGWAAQEAQIELDARKLQNYQDVKAISGAHHFLAAGELNSPVSALLRSFSRLSHDVEAALAQESNYNQRLALNAVEERLDGLLRELTRSEEQYAVRFRPIAATWRQIVADHIQALSEAVESRQEINNPYVIGIPLTEHQEIFVGRSDVSEHLERLLLDYRCPPLLLYGQRRTGKTSLLNNLGKLLPISIIPLFVDLQGPASLAKNYEGFLYNISRAVLTSAKRHREITFPTLTREKLQVDPFTVFDEWLDDIERTLEPQQTLLLTLDEFSALEFAFAKGLLDKDTVLGMFRHIIQHRPRVKVLLSGSHTIDEFEQWASYLINVQTVHISYLRHEEALRLIEQPVKEFALRYEPAACQRIVEVTRCHPALIQLMCSEIVGLKNKQPVNERRLAQLADAEAAIPGALQHGRFFFADIANNQVTPGGLEVLRFLAAQGEKATMTEAVLRARFPDDFDSRRVNLLQRELVELTETGYRFQVELVRRWFI